MAQRCLEPTQHYAPLDCDGKHVRDNDHMHRILRSGRWSVVFNQDFVKQKTGKRSSSGAAANSEAAHVSLSGEFLGEKSPIFPYLAQLSSSPGWHHRDGVVINVAKQAKSFRTPTARFDPKEFCLRTTYGRFDSADGRSEWRILGEAEKYGEAQNPHALLGRTAAVLVSVFRSSLPTKEEDQLKLHQHGKELMT